MDFSHIAELIHRATGLTPEAIGAERLSAAARARMHACGIDQPAAYATFIMHSSRELAELIETILEQGRPFCEEPRSLRAIEQYLQTAWLQGPARMLNVLCAPCGGGEEVYGLAMSILEAGVPRQLYRIDAVEISARNLDRARHGIYPEESLAAVTGERRGRYFRAVQQGHAVTPLLRERVRFIQAGLLDNTLGAAPGHYHIVFCRNLLRYFDAATRSRALATLRGLLAADGLLVVAESERGLVSGPGFRPIADPALPILIRRQDAQEDRQSSAGRCLA